MGNLRDEIYEYINTTPLKPCPFCGGVAVKLKHGMAGKKRVEGVRQSFVQCKKCGCRTPVFTQSAFESWMSVDKQAIDTWNTRSQS